MKSVVLSSTIAISCAVLASAAPTNMGAGEDQLEARMKKFVGQVVQGVATDSKNQKTASAALNPPRPQRHPELTKVMNAAAASNAFASKSYGKSYPEKQSKFQPPPKFGSRSLDNEELLEREFDDDVLEARMKKFVGQVVQGVATDSQNRKTAAAALNPPRPQRHPELNKVMNAAAASNAFASKSYGKSYPEKQSKFQPPPKFGSSFGSRSLDNEELLEREFDDDVLEARMKKFVGQVIQGVATDSQNRKTAAAALNPPRPQRHPELTKVMNAAAASNAFASKSYGKSYPEKLSKFQPPPKFGPSIGSRSLDNEELLEREFDDEFELEARYDELDELD